MLRNRRDFDGSPSLDAHAFEDAMLRGLRYTPRCAASADFHYAGTAAKALAEGYNMPPPTHFASTPSCRYYINQMAAACFRRILISHFISILSLSFRHGKPHYV